MKQTLLTFTNFPRIACILLGLIFFTPVVLAQNHHEQSVLIPLNDSIETARSVTTIEGHGAKSVVSEYNFNKGLITSWEQLVQGKVAGVIITPRGGAPGSGSSIQIRGGTSLMAKEAPLIILDGVPMHSLSVAAGIDVLSFLNPADIASVTVLKDAAAINSYGIITTGGIIQINTKKGETGERFKVNFDTRAALSLLPERVDVLSAREYKNLLQEQYPYLVDVLSGDSETDWQSQIFQNAVSLDNNLAFSGAVKNIPYRFSVGYLKHNGILKTSGLKRSSAALTVNPHFFNNHLQVNLHIRGAEQNARLADLYAIPASIAFNPTQPVSASNKYGGYFEWLDENGNPRGNTSFSPYSLAFNPLSLLEQRKDTDKLNSRFASIHLNYRLPFLSGLKLNLLKNYEKQENNFSSFMPSTMASVAYLGGKLYSWESSRINNFTNTSFTYERAYSQFNSQISLTGGYLAQAFNYTNKTEPTVNERGQRLSSSWGYYESESVKHSFYGRLHYAFKELYNISAALNRFGNSSFSDAKKFVYAPSLAFQWSIGRENFMQRQRLISALDFRISYGVLPLNSQITLSENPFTSSSISVNPSLTHEETKMLNAGADFSFNNKFGGSIDIYQHVTDNLFGLVYVPNSSGYNSYLTNIGSQTSKGIEGSLYYNVIQTDKVNWKLYANAAYGTRVINSLNKINLISTGVLPGSPTSLQEHSPGNHVYSFSMFRQKYDQNGKPIPGMYEDVNDDGRYTYEDKNVEHSPVPKIYYGLNSEIAYRNWSLSLQIRGQVGNYTYNGINSFYGYFKGYSNTSKAYYETYGEYLGQLSDFYLEDASFVRLENVHVEHNLGMFMKEKVNLRLSASLQNAFVLTKYTGRDPEIIGGIDSALHYPQPRIYSFGINVSI